MRKCRHIVNVFGLAAAAFLSLPVGAAVTVTYGDPRRFIDVEDRSNDPWQVMSTLEQFLKELGERYLPAQTDLAIEVLDVDRAGRPRKNLPTEIRVMTGKADPPCIEMSYKLESLPQNLSESRRERVCDVNFLRPLESRYSEHDPLAYEKRMLEQWFRARFAKGAPPR